MGETPRNGLSEGWSGDGHAMVETGFQEISPQGLLQVQFITRSRYAANGFHLGVHHSSQDLWDNLYQKTIRHRTSFEHQCAKSSPELKMLSKSTDRKSLHQD